MCCLQPLADYLDDVEIRYADLRRPDGGVGFGHELTEANHTPALPTLAAGV